MESRIQKTLKQWFPDAFKDAGKNVYNSDYSTLRYFGEYTLNLIKEKKENQREPFKVIYLLYSKGTLYEKNAIENEFFNCLANEESSGSLKEHLTLIPEELREVYLKIILQN